MRKLIDFLLGRSEAAQTLEQTAPVGMQEAIERSTHRAMRLSAAKRNGLEVPATEMADILMPRAAFDMLTKQRAAGAEPVTYTSTADYSSGELAQLAHDRLVTSYRDGEFIISHERQCMWTATPHPEDASYSYLKPTFMELSRLSGFIDNDKAYVTAKVLAHPYGAIAIEAAQPIHLDFYRRYRQQAEANPCATLTDAVPPLPSPEQRAAQQARIDGHVEIMTQSMMAISKLQAPAA